MEVTSLRMGLLRCNLEAMLADVDHLCNTVRIDF